MGNYRIQPISEMALTPDQQDRVERLGITHGIWFRWVARSVGQKCDIPKYIRAAADQLFLGDSVVIGSSTRKYTLIGFPHNQA
jgi:hypothetical protein